MKLSWLRNGLGLLILALMLGHAAQLYQLGLVTRIEAITYDAKVRLSMSSVVDDRIVIVDIDERSLAEQGRWPWGRDKVAALTQKLFAQYDIAVLGFDVVFAESDESSGLASLDRLARGELRNEAAYLDALRLLRPRLDNDARFADAIKGHKVILGYPFSASATGIKTGSLPEPAMRQQDFRVPPEAFAYDTYGGNLARFQSVAAGGGHFTPIPDLDGIIRRVPMLSLHQGNYYEALSLAMVRAVLGSPRIAAGYPEEGPGDVVEWLELRDADKVKLRIPVDEHLAALIPYRGPIRSFPYLSATDLLQDRIPLERLKNKIVLVGTTAPGLLDLRSTPVDAVYPGVEIHANLIAGMLDGAIKQRPAYVVSVDLLILLVVGVVMIFGLQQRSPLAAALGTALLASIVALLNATLWHYANLLVPVADCLILIGLLFALNMSWGFFIETRSKRQFTELFGQYVPPELVDEMAKNPESYSMEGRKAELTVLFSDIRGFTTISEGMEPEELAALMNEYLGAMTDVVRKHRGTLDKYIGDAIMAFWGAPLDDALHARHAVEAALAMQQALATLNTQFVAKGWPHIAIGVGVNTGPMTVGDMGSAVRKSYTVMGDAVNTGARLEGITKQYGVGIIVGEKTREALCDAFVFRELDRVRVKGKDDAVGIYEPLGLVDQLPDALIEELRLWQQALRLYRLQDWEQAELALLNLQRMAPCYLYTLYNARIQHYRTQPPGEGWDGVTAFEVK